MRIGVAARSPRYPMIPHISLLSYNSWGAYFDRYWDVGTALEAVRLLLGAEAWRDVGVRRDRILDRGCLSVAGDPVRVGNLDLERGVGGAVAEVHCRQDDVAHPQQDCGIAADRHQKGRDGYTGDTIALRWRMRRL